MVIYFYDMNEKRLFLLDAYALIYRAYYALIRAPRVTSKGFNTSAIFGFCNTLDEILRKENPSHIAVCFDPPGGSTFRHEMYTLYKAQRDKQPEDITAAIPYIKEILAAYRIPTVEVNGYEADDVIGTLSRMAQAEGFDTYMMTPDKDYGQLVTDRVWMYRPSLKGQGFEVRGPQQVCERYGIASPLQVIDLLALEGDVSDNIPGCPGVGEKTASKLIAEWGSVENLLDHTDQLKGALQRKIIDNSEQIRQSKVLVTIRTDVPLPDSITPDSLIRRPIDVDRLVAVYKELEFKSFIQKLNLPSTPAAPASKSDAPGMGSLFDLEEEAPVADTPAAPLKSSATHPHSYRTIDTPAQLEREVEAAAKCQYIGVSIVSEGTDAMTAKWKSLAISTSEDNAWFYTLPSDSAARAEALAAIEPLFGSSTRPMVVSHDVKRDMLILRNNGIELADRYFDTAVAHYLLDPEMKHLLPMLTVRYLDYEMAEASIPESEVACERADMVLRLRSVFLPMIENQGLASLLNDIELPLVRVLADMEYNGARIDTHELAELSRSYTARLHAMEAEAYKLAGGEFNISSPMQVGEVLFGRMKIDPKAKRTKRGAYSTTEDILEKHRANHPIVDLILRIRALRKLLTTYINALPALINPRTGKIHTSYNQTVTATGRISSTNPNLQNIPVRSDDGREIRRAFVADPGNIFMSVDYSQIELRIMAHLSKDPAMIEAFLSGADIHRATASKIYHETLDEVTDNQRRNAKTANFGIIYGISTFGLSERLGIPRAEAKELIDGYFRTYPQVKECMDKSIELAREQGYVTTIMGRKRMLPDINSRNAVVRGYAERNAINAPIQGSAADIIKIAMVRIYSEMRRLGLRSTMIMQVHDELIFNVVPQELPRLQELVTSCMENAYHGAVPLEVAAGSGRNWLEAH